MSTMKIGRNVGYAGLLVLTVSAAVLTWQTSKVAAAPPPVPYAASLKKSTATAGSPSFQIEIGGTFTEGVRVTADDVPLPTVLASAHEVRATLSAAQLASPTTYEIRVENANGASEPLQLQVTTPRGGFVVDETALTPAGTVQSFQTALLNGDAYRDVLWVTGGNDSAIEFALGSPGGFQSPSQFRTGLRMTSVAAADLDGDGDEDLLAVQGDDARISVLTNDGDGNFSAGVDIPTGHSSSRSLAVADVDGDGDVDIIHGNEQENSISVHTGNGDGTFSGLPPFDSIPRPGHPVVGDFNADGLLDVIVLSSQLGTLARHDGNGNGTFDAAVNISLPAGTSSSLQHADINADGRLDLIMPRQSQFLQPSIQVLLGQGNGTFASPPSPFQPPIQLLASLATTDLNGDGALDVVGTAGPFYYLLRGDRSGNFTLWTQRQLLFNGTHVAAADLNDDGLVDVSIAGMTPNFAEPRVAVIEQRDPGPLPALVIDDVILTETDSSATTEFIPVRLVDAITGEPAVATVPIRFTVAFTDSTAELNSDYDPTPATLFSIGPGASEGAIEVDIVGDTGYEDQEVFYVDILSADGAIVQGGSGLIVIEDNDPVPPPPDQADLAASIALADVPGGAALNATITLRNNGPDPAPLAALSVPFEAFNSGKFTNIQVVNDAATPFTFASYEGGFIRASSLLLQPGQQARLQFTATPTAAAYAPEDLFLFEGSDNPTKLSYMFALAGSAGRTGEAFAGDADGRGNDLVLVDQGGTQISVLRNVDAPGPQIATINVGDQFPNGIVTDIAPCGLDEGGTPVFAVSIVEVAGTAGGLGVQTTTRSFVKPLFVADPSNHWLFPHVLTKSGTIVDLACADLNGDDIQDVVALDMEANTIDTHPSFAYSSDFRAFTSFSPVNAFIARKLLAGDWNADGDLDVMLTGTVAQGAGVTGALSTLAGDGSGGLQASGVIVTVPGFITNIAGGLVLDPTTNAERSVDFNEDGFQDFAFISSTGGTNGSPAVFSAVNRGLAGAGLFDLDLQFSIFEGAPPTPNHGQQPMTMSFGRDGKPHIDVGDGRGTVYRLRNTGATGGAVSFAWTRVDLGGWGPSDIIPMNASGDPGVLFTGVRGRAVFNGGSGSGTNDPDVLNDQIAGVGKLLPGTYADVIDNSQVGNLGRLVASSPFSWSTLDQARVYASDNTGVTVDAQVVNTTDDSVTYVLPILPPAFLVPGAQITLIAETAGGVSTATFVIEEPDLPVLSIRDIQVPESHMTPSGPTVDMIVELSKPSDQPIRVRVRTTDGTALAAADYVAADRIVEIPAGQTQVLVTTYVTNDTAEEADETYFIDLSDAVGATIGDSRGVVTILDNDTTPIVSVHDPKSRTHEPISYFDEDLEVTLSGPSDATVTVRVTTVDGSAFGGEPDSGADYLGRTFVVEFAPGETAKVIHARVNADPLDEDDETFFVDLSEATGATIGRGRATVTIIDNDLPPQFLFSNTSALEGNAGTTTRSLNATLVGPPGAENEGQPTTSGKTVTLQTTASGGTATAGQDYTLPPNLLTLAPGEQSGMIAIDVHGDLTFESDETIALSIVATNASAPPHVNFTIENDDPIPDSTPPTLQVPMNQRVTAATPAGAVVNFPPPVVSDNADPSPTVACVPASGSLFPVGQTTVTCTATDASGNASEATFVVIVEGPAPADVIAPVIGTRLNMRVPAASAAGAEVIYNSPMATDNLDPNPIVACVPESGSIFPRGKTTVTCTATDASGNAAQSTFTITVQEGVARLISRIVAQGVVESSPAGSSVSAAAGRVLFYDVELRNIGDGHARGVTVADLNVRNLAGHPAVVDEETLVPQMVGNLDVGRSASFRIFVRTTGPVSRLELTAHGTFETVLGGIRQFLVERTLSETAPR